MNNKMTINSQLSIIESLKKTKKTTRTGIESQVWRSFGRLSTGRGKGENGEKVQELRSIIGRNKIGRGILRIIEQK